LGSIPGGATLRYGYTAIGDTVNLASRLEALNKEYSTRILLSKATREALPKDAFLVRQLDLVRVEGKEQPVEICELLGRLDSAGELKELVEWFGQGRMAYNRRDWPAAERFFEHVLERWPSDGSAQVFLARAVAYSAGGPPADWDGVYVMKHK
jgi:adenylate cyclase